MERSEHLGAHHRHAVAAEGQVGHGRGRRLDQRMGMGGAVEEREVGVAVQLREWLRHDLMIEQMFYLYGSDRAER